LLSRRDTFQCELVLELTESGVLEHNVTSGLGDDEWAEVDVKLSRLIRFNHDFFRSDFEIIICEGELGAVHSHFLTCGVFNTDGSGATLSHSRNDLHLLHIFRLLNRHVELVEDVLASDFFTEVYVELVVARFEGEEVQLVLFE